MATKKTSSGNKWKLSKAQWVALIIAVLSFISAIIVALINNIIPYILVHQLSSTTATPYASSEVSSSCVLASPTRYGFDCGVSGWDKSSFFKDQAIQAVTTTQFINRNGVSSIVLELTVDFTGSIEERKKQYRESGEAQVNLNSFPPTGFETKAVDLRDHTIVAWIWASKGATGYKNSMNGIQLFIKDNNDRNCYGVWNNIAQEEVWFRVSWNENNTTLCDAGFDSSKPKFLGVKIALGDNSIQIYNIPLTIYIDDVDWQLP